jgi:hypothetical protein
MQEKQVKLNDMVGVWWFITWRTVLVVIIVTILINLLLTAFTMLGVIDLGIFADTLTVIASIFTQIYFLRMAFNRDYKTFRLSTLAKSE